MNIYLSIGCIYKYDLSERLIKHKDVDEIYMDYYFSFDKKLSLNNKNMHYVPMDVFRRHDAVNFIDVSEYSMPGKEIMHKALKYESMALHLGMRETNYPVHTYEESKRAYLFFLRLWNHWIEKINPGLIFFEETPHCMSIYVMYVIARIRGIRVLMINPTGIRLDNYSGGVYIYGDSISRLGCNIGKMYERIKDLKIENFEIKGKIKEYFERSLKGKNESSSSIKDREQWARFVYNQEFRTYALPFYNIRYYCALLRFQINNQIKKNVDQIEKNTIIRNRELRRRTHHYIKKYCLSLKEYERMAVLPDYNKKFVYFPLQQMPEMTLFPLAASYGEQYNTIQYRCYHG